MTDKIKQVYLAQSLKKRFLIIMSIIILAFVVTITPAYGTDPVIILSGWTPANSTTIASTKPAISANVVSTTSDLKPSSVTAKIDGNTVLAILTLKGHYQEYFDGEGYDYNWVTDSNREGTISMNSPELAEGTHNVEVTIADMGGNSQTGTSSFSVDAPPKFTELSPAASSIVGSLDKISAVVSDSAGINWSTVVFKLDGTIVQHTTGGAIGTVSYEGVIADGDRTVLIEAKDKNGNLGSKTWIFNKNSVNAVACAWSPAKDSKVSAPNPQVSVYITASDDLNAATLVAKIDNIPVTPNLVNKGHMGRVWIDDPEEGWWEPAWITDSYKEGTVTFTPPVLNDGVHEALVTIADKRGNLLTEKWSFTVGCPPTFTVSPAASNQYDAIVSAVIADNGSVNWSTVIMKINNTAVTTEVSQETATVSYKGPCPNGTVNVYVEAKDTAGNLGSKTWSFTNASSGPQFSSITSGTTTLVDGYTITNGTLAFRGYIDDVVPITSVKATVDGAPLTIESTTTSDLKHINYNYTGVITNGQHTLVVTATNQVGVSKSQTRTVNVNTQLVFSNMTPFLYGVTDLTPLISVDYKSLNGPIVPQSVKLTVDGVEVNNIQATAGKVTYQSGQLSDESYHTVNVTIKDNSGLSSTATWKFYTNGNNYPDMADSNVSNCTTCHAGYTGLASHPLQLVDNQSHNYESCVNCHSFISQPADCQACHSLSHGTSTAISYNATNNDPTFPLRIKTNREMVDCVICHQPGANVKGHYSYPDPRYTLVAATKPVDGHDIPELHKNTDTSCNKCHAQSLTKEHARPGSVDKDGNAITCNTCHKSTNPDVVKAIANKITKCDACHVNANHDQLHVWDGFDANCVTCHANTLTTEHLSNVKTGGGVQNDCATCHESDNKAVKRTIASKNLSCTGCHSAAHGLQLVDSFPTDIPKYPGYQWSSPNEASLFLGESTTPANYDSGQVIISNRSAEITVDQVWKYYNEQTDTRMSVQGWVLKSGSFTSGANNFVAEYEKEGRFVTIKCYNSVLSDGTGLPPSGSKIEVWYK